MGNNKIHSLCDKTQRQNAEKRNTSKYMRQAIKNPESKKCLPVGVPVAGILPPGQPLGPVSEQTYKYNIKHTASQKDTKKKVSRQVDR